MSVYVMANLIFGSYKYKDENKAKAFNQKLIENWNQFINNNDSICLFGLVGGETRKETREVLKQLNGLIYLCNYNDNKRFDRNSFKDWNIHKVWNVNFKSSKKKMNNGEIYFCSFNDYQRLWNNNKNYGVIWNREEDIVYKDRQLSIDAKYWDSIPILLDEIPDIIERLKDFKEEEE